MNTEPAKPELDAAEPGGVTDLRTLRSREALRNALLLLLEEKPLAQITARDVTATARVGYATFFRHYTGIAALLDDLATAQVNQLMHIAVPVIDAVDTRAACTTLCNHVARHRALWTTLLTGGAAGAIREEFLHTSRDYIAQSPRPPATWMPMGLGVILTVTCTVELLSWWLSQTEPLPVDSVAELLNGVLYQRLLNDDPGGRLV